MKVKDLIAQLKRLDPDKDIFVAYDRYEFQEPDFEYFEQMSVTKGNEHRYDFYAHDAY